MKAERKASDADNVAMAAGFRNWEAFAKWLEKVNVGVSPKDTKGA